MNKLNISGLLLAGGRGSRLGGKDKGLLHYKDKTLAESQVSWLNNQLDICYISANRNIDYYCQFGLPVLMDPQSNFEGPLTGVLKALEQCQTDWLFVLPVDVPSLPSDLIDRIVLNISGSQKAYYLISDEREHYLIMLISKAALSDLVSYCASGEKRVRGFLQNIEAEPLNLGVEESEFENLNYKEDLNSD